MNDILSSSIATCTAELITIPIYTIKTNYQNNDNISIPKVFKHIYTNYGIKGFYNSFGMAMFSQMVSTSAKYTLYQKIKPHLSSKILSGTLSGIISSVLTHPIDVVKIHFQMQTSFIKAFKKIGIAIFYRGYSKSLLKSSIGSSCFFPFYDIFNEKIKNITLSAIFSATLSTTILQPIDYMKTRQTYGLHYGYNPLMYFKGLSLNLSRVVPHFIITISIIEYMKNNILNK